jgi:hypothetical protein
MMIVDCFSSVRKTGYRQCVAYLLTNTRVRLDDFNQFYPIDKLVDLFIHAQITNSSELQINDHVNVRHSRSISNGKLLMYFFFSI